MFSWLRKTLSKFKEVSLTKRQTVYLLLSLFLVLTLPLAIFLAQQRQVIEKQAAGNVYYVATNGDDSNPGTIDKPWRTIQKAADTVQAGDTIYVRAGTYSGEIQWTKSGTSTAHITVRNYPGETFTILGGSYGIYLDDDNNAIEYVDFIGDPPGSFEITGWTNQYYGGVHVQASRGINHCTFEGLEVHHAKGWGFRLAGAFQGRSGYLENNIIENSYVHDLGTKRDRANTQGYGLVLWCGNRHTIIRNSKFYNNARLGVSVSCPDDQGGFDWERDMNRSIQIYNNEFWDNGDRSWENGIQVWNVKGIEIYNNEFHDNYDGIQIFNAEKFNVYNNLIYSNKDHGIRIFRTSSHLSGNVYHNTSYNNHGCNLHSSSGYTESSNIKNNVLYNGSDGDLCLNNASNLEASNNLAGQDPLFVNAQGGDFHLQANSPAIDAGVDVGIDTDFDGIPRPQGAGYDIGAFEYTSGPQPTLTPRPSTPTPVSPTPTPPQTPALTSTPTSVPPTPTPSLMPTPTIPPGTPTATIRPETPTPTTKPPPAWCQRADVNGDGAINARDFFAIVESYARQGENIPGDLNRDRVVNALDLSLLLVCMQKD